MLSLGPRSRCRAVQRTEHICAGHGQVNAPVGDGRGGRSSPPVIYRLSSTENGAAPNLEAVPFFPPGAPHKYGPIVLREVISCQRHPCNEIGNSVSHIGL
ncbi:hypothetical protein D3C86_1064440 [compost metagenome]